MTVPVARKRWLLYAPRDWIGCKTANTKERTSFANQHDYMKEYNCAAGNGRPAYGSCTWWYHSYSAGMATAEVTLLLVLEGNPRRPGKA